MKIKESEVMIPEHDYVSYSFLMDLETLSVDYEFSCN